MTTTTMDNIEVEVLNPQSIKGRTKQARSVLSF